MRRKSSFRFVKTKFIRVNSNFIREKSTRKWYINQDFMFKHISLITGVEIVDISTARLYELLFEIV